MNVAVYQVARGWALWLGPVVGPHGRPLGRFWSARSAALHLSRGDAGLYFGRWGRRGNASVNNWRSLADSLMLEVRMTGAGGV